jgi:transposase
MATKTFTEQEAVRLVGLRMLARGKSNADVIDALAVGPATVSNWRVRLRRFQGDPEAAAPDAARPGRPDKLTEAQREELKELLLAGAEAAGFDSPVWTLRRVRRAIFERFGVEYHKCHLGRLLAELGFSPQKPVKRAAERDEQAIETFRQETWPSLVKKGV